MMHNNHFMFWATRSIGKTWLTALFCVVRCILYPKTKICVASATRPQGNEVLSKIEDDFMKNYGWGSDNLRREITYCSIGANKAIIKFKNNSWIKVVTASDNARGSRANVIVLDEFRMLDKDIIATVIRKFLGTPRQPLYLNLPKYKNNPNLLETNIDIYMSSAWMKAHWSYDKSKSYVINLLGHREGYFVCALPYQMSIKEGLKKKVEIEDEMSEADFDEATFNMEMCCMPMGDNEASFFTFEDISKCRKLKNAVYFSKDLSKNKKPIPDLLLNEERILSVDIALMASKKHDNDAASIIVNSAIPTTDNNYVANIIYLKNYEGLRTEELALIIRKLYDEYKCTALVIDTNGSGIGIYDALSKDMVDYETGDVYRALSCVNDPTMAERCKDTSAPKVIWSIKATQQFNTEMCILLRNGFKNNRINLLVNEFEAEEYLKDKIKNYNNLIDWEKLEYKSPFIQTTLLVYELINLESEIRGTNVKIIEKSGKRKDRYSSLGYNFWVMKQLEIKKLRKEKSGFNVKDFAKQLGKLNRKPKTY